MGVKSLKEITDKELALIFLKIGSSSFGGWSTTALLLEKELIDKRNLLARSQLDGAVAYAQMLPGATQVAIVSNVGYRLKGLRGAITATTSYLLPALSLITLFAAIYFHYVAGTDLMRHLGGLIAALGGIILANAYHIGKRHATHWTLWFIVVVAVIAKLWLGLNALIIIILFGAVALAVSWLKQRKQSA
jgi:chromate transporter